MKKLTAPQIALLKKAAASKYGRPGYCHPAVRTKLVELGLLDLEGYHYGPLFKITAAGLEAVKENS
jgi:hypothetical protein